MAKKLLIIDDNINDINLVQNIFAKKGISVVSSVNPFDAFEFIYSETPDIIVLDALMPQMGGYELCRKIKSDELTKNIPIVIYTCLEKHIDKYWALSSGANAFVCKKSTNDELISTVFSTMEQFPVDFEVKSKLLENKMVSDNKTSSSVANKNDVIKDFSLIKEFDAPLEMLSLRIFGVISKYFRYDLAMLYFEDEVENEQTLFFDIGSLDVSQNVFSQIAQVFTGENSKPQIKIVSKKDFASSVSDIAQFSVRYEFEFVNESKTTGRLHIYSKENVNSNELKLLNVIKEQVEHIIRLCYYRDNSSEVKSSANPKKLYTQLDFDRLISYECDWHRRNNVSLFLSLLEIDMLENIEKTYGKEYCDFLVAKLSNILSRCLKVGDFIYRNEDNTFAILMTNSQKNDVENKISHIKQQIDKVSNEQELTLNVNICALSYEEKYKNHYEYTDALYDLLDEVRHSDKEVVIG